MSGSSKKRQRLEGGKQAKKIEEPVDESSDEEVEHPKIATVAPDDDEDESPPVAEGRQIYIILDGAQLETVKTKKGDFQLLNCDDHVNIMKRHGKDPQQYRPDIIHQVTSVSYYLHM